MGSTKCEETQNNFIDKQMAHSAEIHGILVQDGLIATRQTDRKFVYLFSDSTRFT